MAIVNRINKKSKPISERYPRIKALINNQGPNSSIVKIVRKVTAKEKFHTSVDAEAAQLRAALASPEEGQYTETSFDREKKSLIE